MTYDDLLLRLDDAVSGTGPAAARLRARYDVVLVDEFQDTDPVQWNIMQRSFGDTDGALILIGDPKQALYSFRGADVYAYLAAKRAATTHATLDVNRRSDQGLIDAYDVLFDDAKLGHEGIVYRRVHAAPANRTSRLSGAPCDAPLRIRVVARDEPTIALTRGGFATSGSAREHVAKDVAADIVTLLRSQAEIEHRAADGTADPARAGSPGAHRGVGADEPNGGVDQERTRRRGRGRRHQRCGQRVRDTPGARVAATAGGARTSEFDDTGAFSSPHDLPGTFGRAGRAAGRERLGTRARTAARLGADAAGEGRRVSDGGDDARRGTAGTVAGLGGR